MGMKYTHDNITQDAFKRNSSPGCHSTKLDHLEGYEVCVSGGAQTAPPSGGISTSRAHGIMNPMDNIQILCMGKMSKIPWSYEKRVG